MCTFILAWQVFPDAPVVVAANRDEALDRPAHPPGVYSENPRIVAPWDEQAGGTWIGYNEGGVTAAITNRWIDADSAERSSAGSRTRSDDLAGERSRGLLVGDALERDSAEEAARFVERELRERDYEGFNLVLADRNAALLLEWDGHLRVRNFDPGVHIVVNIGADDQFTIPESRPELGERQAENASRAREELRPEPGETADEWHDRAAAILSDHDYGFCVHGDGFGTRSSSLIRMNTDETATYRFAGGPPCRTDYEPIDTSA